MLKLELTFEAASTNSGLRMETQTKKKTEKPRPEHKKVPAGDADTTPGGTLEMTRWIYPPAYEPVTSTS